MGVSRPVRHRLGRSRVPSPGRDARSCGSTLTSLVAGQFRGRQLLGARADRALRPLILVILFLAGFELLRAGAGATMTRWKSLKAPGPHKSSPCQLVASRRRLSAPALAASQESGSEPPSQHSLRGSPCHWLPTSWPRQKQCPPFRPCVPAPQRHGEVVSCSGVGGGWQSEERCLLQGLGAHGGRLRLRWFKSQLSCLMAVWPGESHLTSLNLHPRVVERMI